MLEQVAAQISEQSAVLPRQGIVERALAHARLIRVAGIEQAIGISNAYAPEHLILSVREPRRWLAQVSSAGSVFLGDYAPEALGDYCSGTNHVLPTYGAARAWSGVSVASFQKAITVQEVTDKSILKAAMTPIPMAKTVVAAGGVSGNGSTIVVENNSDNTLVTFRFKNAGVKMAAAEESFTADGHTFAPGAIIIANANRAQIDASLKSLGLTGYAVASAPTVKSHDLDIPRIGYIHSWTRTQDEGWVRAALDTYGVPYSYFGENALAKMGDGSVVRAQTTVKVTIGGCGG